MNSKKGPFLPKNRGFSLPVPPRPGPRGAGASGPLKTGPAAPRGGWTAAPAAPKAGRASEAGRPPCRRARGSGNTQRPESKAGQTSGGQRLPRAKKGRMGIHPSFSTGSCRAYLFSLFSPEVSAAAGAAAGLAGLAGSSTVTLPLMLIMTFRGHLVMHLPQLVHLL